jgi:outer membrane protein assembly factor BamE (lipoprotein component of BamABCDE complex)
MMRKIILSLTLLAAFASPAFAVCPSTLQVKDNAAVTGNVVYSDDGGGNCLPNVKLNGTAAATQSGTWTVQPGNTANTTAWLVTGTGGTFPSAQSGTWNITNITGTVSLPTGASTSALQTTGNTSLGTIATNTTGASTAANQTATQGSKTGGAAASNSDLVGGVYNSSPPTLTTGQQAALQFDVNGNLKTNVANTNANGRATPANSSPVVLPANKYQAVAASQTATSLVGAGSGATGDYLSHCVIYPQSTSPGVVTVFDSTNTAANSAILFAGGATSTSNLTPISVPVGALSVNGAWKVTTGTNVSVVCYGNFT